jgi:hypothetical protein
VNYLTFGPSGEPHDLGCDKNGQRGVSVMESRTQVAQYAATMTKELCRMCKRVELNDLAYLLEVAAAEATKVRGNTPTPVRDVAHSLSLPVG